MDYDITATKALLPSNHRRRIGRGERDADMEAFRRLAERKKAANDLVSQKAYAEAADEFHGVVQDGRQQLGRFAEDGGDASDAGERQDGLRGQLEALVATSSNNLGLCYLKLFRHADCVRAINELFRTTHARSVRAELRNCKKMTDHPSLPQNGLPDVVRGLFDSEAAFADARCLARHRSRYGAGRRIRSSGSLVPLKHSRWDAFFGAA